MSDICENCGFSYKSGSNVFGKICRKCGNYIESSFEFSIVKNNKKTREKLIREAIMSIITKGYKGKNNAN